MATVTIQGGGNVTVGDTIQAAALGSVIQNLNFLGRTIGHQVDPNLVAPGGAGSFNFISVSGGSAPTTLTAQGFVNAIIDSNTGNDTITGDKSTRAIVTNNANNVVNIDSNVAVILGTGDNTVNIANAFHAVTGTIVDEGGHNSVVLGANGNVKFEASTIPGDDTVTSSAGSHRILSDYAVTVNIQGNGSLDTVGVAAGSMINAGGQNDAVDIVGSGLTLNVTSGTNNSYIMRGAGGADTVNVGGGNGNLIDVRAGNSLVDVTGGSSEIDVRGNDTVNISGGQATINVIGSVFVNQTGAGNDTIDLGAKGGALVVTGSASVVGGSGNFSYDGSGSSSSDTVVAGSGGASILGGSGADSIVAGTGHDFITVGSGTDTLDFSGAVATGTYSVSSYNTGDIIHIAGGSTHAEQIVGGNTIITIDGTTKVTLVGFNNPSGPTFG